jgi:hypothetical protein
MAVTRKGTTTAKWRRPSSERAEPFGGVRVELFREMKVDMVVNMFRELKSISMEMRMLIDKISEEVNALTDEEKKLLLKKLADEGLI